MKIGTKTIERLFDKWEAELVNKKKGKDSIPLYAEDFFEMLADNGVDIDTAYEYLERVITALSPTSQLIKYIYKTSNIKSKTGVSESEFGEDWKKRVRSDCYEAFHIHFEIGETKRVNGKYGNMSAAEYKKQRAYAESHPLIDLDALPDKKPLTIEEIEEMKQKLGIVVDGMDEEEDPKLDATFDLKEKD